MGIFSGKTIYSVSTSTSRVIEDESLSDSVLETLAKAIMQDSPLAESLVDGYTTSVGYRIEQMARKAPSIYPDGQMKSDLASNTGQRSLIKQAIETELGQTVSLEYAVLAPINYPHLVWQTLTESYGYDRDSNRLTGLAGDPYLKTFRVEVPQDEFDRALTTGGTQALGDSPIHGTTPQRPGQVPALRPWVDNPPAVVGDTRSDILVEVIHVDTAGNESLLSFTLAPEGDSDMEFYQAMYLAGGQPGYWTYRYGAGTHAALDSAYALGAGATGDYLPVVYFRLNHNDLSDASLAGTDDYDAAAELLDLIGMDYASMGESIHENPDIDDVRNAFLMFGVSGNSTEALDARYLYAFFSDLHSREGQLDPPPPPLSVFNRGGLKQAVTLNIEPVQELGEHRLGARLRLTHGGSTKRLRHGRIAAVGEATHSTDSIEETVRYLKKVYDPEKGLSTYEEATTTVTRPVLVLRYQLSSRAYQELRIVDPSLRHQIDGSGRVTHNGLGDPDFLIPLDRGLLEDWNLRDRERLYQRSMHLVFNARQKTKLAWYETAFFKFVLVVAAIVITIYTGIPAYQAMAATFAAGGLVALTWAVLVAVVKMAAFQIGFKLIAEELGAEFALVAAVILAVYGGFRSFQAGSVEGAPWASEMLQAANGLSKAAGQVYQDELAGLAQEYDDLLGIEEEREAELEAARSLLNTNSHLLNPVNFIWGESPEDFYRRTVHSGNVGVVGFDAVHSYVDIALKLPETQSTLEGGIYG